ncbi:Maf family protein [Saccharomonospora piscinae]|uniref:Maf family protein n=1 Tax=Saccharomonospora piscinae TaxID=687388 RepID=UPI000466CB80|nr:nucleoside triphosphate pyrophosphatase [Saccharomonospora piscinae]TLW89603.1 septum formation inhibitor Maf [Saccharomonospora piscinae]
MRFVLASASPARLAVLRAAGVDPDVVVSGVDEAAIIASLSDPAPAELVRTLAAAKADDVAAGVLDGDARGEDTVIVGCDSMLSIGGEVVGKPGTPEVARTRWKAMSGGSGELLTGHAVVRLRDGVVAARAEGTRATTVRFAAPEPQELDAYIATGEPLAVAGAFTLDGLGGWFVEGVDGDPSSVIGISLPLTRGLLAEVGVGVVSLWGARPGA